MLSAGLPAGMPPGTFGAQLLRGAVELVEPALPPFAHEEVDLPADAAGYSAVSWLAGRDLLPAGWEEELPTSVWDSMLSGFAGWYGVSPEGLDPERQLTRDQMVADLDAVLNQVGEAVRPVAVVAVEADEPVFLGVMWNWSVYPRLLVLRTGGAVDLEQALEAAGTCAVEVRLYVQASLDTAWRLFSGNGGDSSTMYVLDSDPPRPDWPAAVPSSDVRDFLTFSAPAVRGLAAYSAVFSGEPVGVATMVSLALQVRTNVPLPRIGYYLAVPGQ